MLALSSNYALYADMSNRVVATVAQFTPDYEVYSIDECLLKLDGFRPAGLTDYAQQLKAAVLQCTGLPVCVGIAHTKTLAKLANHCAKKRPQFEGVCNFNGFSEKNLNAILMELPVGEVWGIGSRLEAKLNRIGIGTVLDLKRAHARILRDQFSVMMVKTIAELNGDVCIDLE